MRAVRVLVCAPDDVEHERRRIEHVAERLSGEYAGLAHIETIWRPPSFYRAQGTPGRVPWAAECDIVLAVFWSRLGSELPPEFPHRPDGEPYPSGAAFEVLSALAARESSAGRPCVVVFRKTARRCHAVDDEAGLARARAEWTRLQSFFERHFATAAGVLRNFESIDELDQAVEALLREWIATRVLRGRPSAWPIALKGSPFRALAPFEAEHAPVFFGRAREVAQALERLMAAAARGMPFLLVAGPSGVGKSSLVRAGLVPRLTSPGVIAGVDAWRVALMRPGPRPIEVLGDALLAGAVPALPELGVPGTDIAALLRGEEAVPAILRALDRVAAAGGGEAAARAGLLLVVDELDELFAADIASADRAAFAALMRALAASGRVWVVATLRAALYEPFLEQPDLAALLERGAGYDLAAPAPAQLAEMVRGPAAAAGLAFETDPGGERLDERLLREAGGAGALPLLQFTLHCLFAERRIVGSERRLTFAACAALGGVGGAVERAAERALARLPADAVAALPRLLRRLVVEVPQARPAATGGSALVPRDLRLIDAAADPAAQRLVDALVEARMLLHANERGVATIRLAHLQVLESWRRAREIVAEDFGLLRARRAVAEQGRRWQEGGRRSALLLARGLPLAQAETVVAAFGGDLDAGTRRFVATSARHARLRERASALAIAALVVVALVAGWHAFAARTARQLAEQSQRAAAIEHDRAERRRELAELARDAAETQRGIAQRRADEAEELRLLAEARRRDAQDEQRRTEALGLRIRAQQQQAERVAERLAGELAQARDRAVAAQSRLLAELADRKLEAGDGVTAALIAIEALPDRKSGDLRPPVSEARLGFERASRARGDGRFPHERALIGDDGVPMLACALSGDGARAVTAGADATLRLWDAGTGRAIAQMRGRAQGIAQVAFSADGTRIVAAVGDGLRVLDAATGAELALLPEQRSLIAVGDDGARVMSVSAGNRLHLWDAGLARETTWTMAGAILAVRLGAEGARVLVAAPDNSIALYDALAGRRLRSLRGHARRVLTASFSPDGRRIASIAEDRTARVWSAADGRQLLVVADPGLHREVAVGLAAEQALLPFASGLRLYSVNAAKLVAELPSDAGAAALLAPDGRFILTAAAGAPADTFAKLWDGESGKLVARLEQGSATACMGVSGDGRRLLTGGRDGIGRIWSFGADAGGSAADLETLVEHAKAQLPRCLTRAQRAAAHLDAEPPAWCIELAKWPYRGQAWKDWLAYRREGARPPFPDTPEWRSWLALRAAGAAK